MEYLHSMEIIIKNLRYSAEHNPNPQADENSITLLERCWSRVKDLRVDQQPLLYQQPRQLPSNYSPGTHSTFTRPIRPSSMDSPTSSIPRQPFNPSQPRSVSSEKKLREARKRIEEEAIVRMRAQLQYAAEQERIRSEQAVIEDMKQKAAQDFHKGKMMITSQTTHVH